jgi:DNA invertase Pin-like site-specific DNA recombinase
MFAVIAAMAEFERELIRERIHPGLIRSKAVLPENPYQAILRTFQYRTLRSHPLVVMI